MKKFTLLLFALIPFIGFSQVDLPITFEDTASVDYMLSDFGGNVSAIVVDPTDTSNLVGQATKTDVAEIWAGTTNGGNGLATAIPFSDTDTRISVRVWSPDAETPVRLKVENAADGGVFVEAELLTSSGGEWNTLTFDFGSQVEGTPGLDLSQTYDKISIFFNFGTTGADAGEKTYYWDDIIFAGGGGIDPVEKVQVDMPITFEDTATVDYALADFGGNASMIVVDPTNENNLVGQAIKEGPETWAGTVIGGSGLANAIPFTAEDTKISVRVWSPTAGTPILLKIENAADGGIFAETSVNTTMAETWETLEFDMSAPANGVFDLANVYDKIVIFFDFGTVGTGQTYYWDDMIFLGASEPIEKEQVDMPITFEDTASVDYDLADFGGNASMIVVDPTDESNLVGQAIKDGPETWAGTVIGGSGLANAIPFTAADTKISVRVWSPTAGTPILLKIENAADGGIFAETSVNTTMAETWETLEFDMAAPANGVFDLANVYDKIVIFFDFGTVGTGQTYYWDDMVFLGASGVFELVKNELAFQVYPNLTRDYTTVSWSEIGEKTISVYDVTGTLLQRINVNPFVTEQTIDVNGYNQGTYFIRIDSESKVGTKKLVVGK